VNQHLHLLSPKLIPWFVSDVTPADFSLAITSLLDQSFFNAAVASNDNSLAGHEHLKHMVTRWKTYIDQGVFALSVSMGTELGGDQSGIISLAEFWTSPWPYWQMKDCAHGLFQSLVESDLVIFKVRETPILVELN
jgi:damage-control phosphatase, subfamily III